MYMQNPDYIAAVAGEVRAGMARNQRKPAELAELLGISRPTVTRCLSGERPFDVDELVTVAEWLEVPVADLLVPQIGQVAS